MTRFLFVALVALTACQSAPKTLVGLPVQLRPENETTTGTLAVHVTGIPSVQGTVFIELYDRATYFDFSRVPNEQVVTVTANEMTVTLEHVPAGRYIVVGSHDANGNNELDTGFLGIPTETYGFSRGARGAFGPPDFEAGAFDFDGTTASVPLGSGATCVSTFNSSSTSFTRAGRRCSATGSSTSVPRCMLPPRGTRKRRSIYSVCRMYIFVAKAADRNYPSRFVD